MTSQSLHRRSRTGIRRNPRGASLIAQRRDRSIQMRLGAASDVKGAAGHTRSNLASSSHRQLVPPRARCRYRGDRRVRAGPDGAPAPGPGPTTAAPPP